MANKETKRERRDAARLARAEAQRRAARKKKMRQIYTGLTVVGVVVAIVVAVSLSGREKAALVADLNAAATTAGCGELQNHRNDGATHVDPPADLDYKTNPPSSGNHYPTWDRTGIHLTPIVDEIQVHNLEHGHVGIQYKADALSSEVIAALEAVVKGNDSWSFMAPKPDLDAPLAFSAWTRTVQCEEPGAPADVAAYAELFIDSQRDQGRESIPGSPNQAPGS